MLPSRAEGKKLTGWTAPSFLLRPPRSDASQGLHLWPRGRETRPAPKARTNRARDPHCHPDLSLDLRKGKRAVQQGWVGTSEAHPATLHTVPFKQLTPAKQLCPGRAPFPTTLGAGRATRGQGLTLRWKLQPPASTSQPRGATYRCLLRRMDAIRRGKDVSSCGDDSGVTS